MINLIYGAPKRVTSSTLIYTGVGYLFSMLIGTNAVDDPTVAVYDDTDASEAGNIIVPSNQYDAAVLGINGVVLKFAKRFTTGLYVKITCAGTVEVIVDYRAAATMHKIKVA